MFIKKMFKGGLLLSLLAGLIVNNLAVAACDQVSSSEKILQDEIEGDFTRQYHESMIAGRVPLEWCDCTNGPKSLRLILAARLALQAKEQFFGHEVLNITSFATGGMTDGKVQLLQEFSFIAALYRVWNTEKDVQINLFLIGPELNIPTSPEKKSQVDVLRENVDGFVKRLDQQCCCDWVFKIKLNIHTFNTHQDYIEEIKKNAALKANILISVDGQATFFSECKGSNGLMIRKETTMGDFPLGNLIFVDHQFLKNDKQVKDPFLMFFDMPAMFKNHAIREQLISALKSELSSDFLHQFAQKFARSERGFESEGRLALLVQAAKEKLQNFCEKSKFSVSECMSHDLAFKELIVHTLKSDGLVYSLQGNILWPDDYKRLMGSPSFYSNPDIHVQQWGQMDPLCS